MNQLTVIFNDNPDYPDPMQFKSLTDFSATLREIHREIHPRFAISNIRAAPTREDHQTLQECPRVTARTERVIGPANTTYVDLTQRKRRKQTDENP
jgi:hypothetical protein